MDNRDIFALRFWWPLVLKTLQRPDR